MSKNEARMPMAARAPNSLSAGMSLVRLVAKPTAVVTVASTSATPTVRMAADTESSTEAPRDTSSRYREVTWIE